jgi:AraC-like DNA-binding protein
MDTFIVICKPTVFSHVFGIDLTPIPKQSIDLPCAIFQPLWNELSQLRTTEERINHFTDFINSFQHTPYQPDAIDIFYNKIMEKGTTVLLKEIVRECPASQRTLERYFIKRTGVTPKTLMRIVRLDYLWTKIKDEKAIDYQDLIFDGNYFDQAHFINDFKSIIGETPNYFFNRNLQITKMFSGRAEGTVL